MPRFKERDMGFERDYRVPCRATWLRHVGILLVVLTLFAAFVGAQASATSRKVRNKVVPTYPELARKINLVATVKVQITISPNGSVTEAKAVGGHPLLIGPSVDAAKQWRYEPAGDTTTMIIEFHFGPGAN